MLHGIKNKQNDITKVCMKSQKKNIIYPGCNTGNLWYIFKFFYTEFLI